MSASTGDQLSQLADRELGHRAREHHPAILEHDDSVGELIDLFQPVGHEQDRDTTIAERLQPVDQVAGLLPRQPRRRLVEDEDVAAHVDLVHDPCDRNQGSLDRAQLGDVRHGIDIQRHLLQHVASAFPLTSPGDGAESTAGIALHRGQVVGDR